MGDAGRIFPDRKPAELHELDETQPVGEGHVEFDELGNAVWVPYGGLGSEEVMARLLNDTSLSLSTEDSRGGIARVQPNPGGIKRGYDPYDSGLLVKKTWKKKKDLRALSNWIEQQKKLQGRG